MQAISDRLAADVASYTAPGFGTVTSAGATAKAVVLAEAVGADPASYGGTDLVAQLERTVADRGPAAGRIQDVLDPEERSAADYANVVGQAYAVQGARRGRQPGGRRGDDVPARAAVQRRLVPARLQPRTRRPRTRLRRATRPASRDLDTTSFALRALVPTTRRRPSRPRTRAAGLAGAAAGEGRLVRRRRATGTPNTNSTGLAGTALAEAGDTAAAERAATWVFGRQAVDCQKFPPAVRGAIAYDDAGRRGRRARASRVKAADQFRRASAGALPVLRWLRRSATADQPAGSC